MKRFKKTLQKNCLHKTDWLFKLLLLEYIGNCLNKTYECLLSAITAPVSILRISLSLTASVRLLNTVDRNLHNNFLLIPYNIKKIKLKFNLLIYGMLIQIYIIKLKIKSM